MGTVFENGRFGKRFYFWKAVLVGVFDFETPTKRIVGVSDFSKTDIKRKTRFEKV